MSEGVPSPHPVRTTCPYCGVGCGVLATPDGTGGAAMAGDPEHPANFGALCVKGAALGETLKTDSRLTTPLIDRLPTTWPRAIRRAADMLRETAQRHGPESIAFYLSGQLLTEDYYVANKLAKGFIGTPHVDTNSRLCMASSVAGHRRAFGADVVPNAYADLDLADLVVLVGSNAAWCHPVLYRRMQAAREARGTRLIVIDPRRTATAEGADLHLPIAPGMDGVLWSHLLVEIDRRGAVDADFRDRHTSGYAEALAGARAIAPDAATAAARCGLTPADLARFVDLWIGTDRVVSAYSQGVNQSAQGTDKVNAILNCHLATGRIGKPGCGPFSLTGQPNAMGGREVGGLANMLAAHMGFSPAERERVAGFWQAPNLVTGEGLKAVDMFEAVADGRIKALWVMCTNPAVSLPRADAVRGALRRLDALIVSESHAGIDGLLEGAHVAFPAAPWGEKDGTVTNSERRISRQRAFLPVHGEARPDWRIVCDVAAELGFGEAFAYPDAAEIFREHAALSALDNHGTRAFDLGGLADLSDSTYDTLAPVQWPVAKGTTIGRERLFAEGGFVTPDGRARLIPIAPPRLHAEPDADHPLWLNTGRVRDHWHTMSRTRLAPRLNRHILRPFLEIHPDDAAACGLAPGDYAEVTGRDGRVVLDAVLTDAVRRGTVFAPIHWNDLTAGSARVGALVHAATDPYSGQPEAKAVPVRVRPAGMLAHGVLLTRTPITPPRWLVHARVTLPDGGEALIVAAPREPEALSAMLANYLPANGDRLTLEDAARGRFGALMVDGERPLAAFFVTRERDDARMEWLIDRFATGRIDAPGRRLWLAGRDLSGDAAAGPVICACHGVTQPTILAAIAAGAGTVDAVGQACAAGTNCGSCRPEIARFLRDASAIPEARSLQPEAQPA